jgi:hypothetical protein
VDDKHIMIAGPGRSGTTLLVRLLEALGFETGSSQLWINEYAHAGLEADLLASDAPYVVKSPALSWQLRSLIEDGRLDPCAVEWLLVPLRSLDDVTASRVTNSTEQRDVHSDGGLIGTVRPRKQREWLAAATYGLFETAALYELPLITLEYPRFAMESGYAFRRLKPLLRGCEEAEFEIAWRAVVDPSLIRSEPIEMPRFADVTIALARLKFWVKGRIWAVRRRLFHQRVA